MADSTDNILKSSAGLPSGTHSERDLQPLTQAELIAAIAEDDHRDTQRAAVERAEDDARIAVQQANDETRRQLPHCSLLPEPARSRYYQDIFGRSTPDDRHNGRNVIINFYEALISLFEPSMGAMIDPNQNTAAVLETFQRRMLQCWTNPMETLASSVRDPMTGQALDPNNATGGSILVSWALNALPELEGLSYPPGTNPAPNPDPCAHSLPYVLPPVRPPPPGHAAANPPARPSARVAHAAAAIAIHSAPEDVESIDDGNVSVSGNEHSSAAEQKASGSMGCPSKTPIRGSEI